MAIKKDPDRKRSEAVKISLSPPMREKLQFVADTLGMPASQVASMAVSEYVASKSIAFGVAESGTNKMIEAMGPHMAELFQSLAANNPKD